jgi:hypothetical protein
MTTKEQIEQLKAEIETAKKDKAARELAAKVEEEYNLTQVDGLSLRNYLDDQEEAYIPRLG